MWFCRNSVGSSFCLSTQWEWKSCYHPRNTVMRILVPKTTMKTERACYCVLHSAIDFSAQRHTHIHTHTHTHTHSLRPHRLGCAFVHEWVIVALLNVFMWDGLQQKHCRTESSCGSQLWVESQDLHVFVLHRDPPPRLRDFPPPPSRTTSTPELDLVN